MDNNQHPHQYLLTVDNLQYSLYCFLIGLQYAVICRLGPSFCGIEGWLCNLSAKYKHLSISWKVCVWSTTLNPIINTSTNSIIYLYRYSLYLLILFFCMTFTITFFAVTLIALTCLTSIHGILHLQLCMLLLTFGLFWQTIVRVYRPLNPLLSY